MAYTFPFTNGNVDLAKSITTDADLTLGKGQKNGVVAITASAASKTITAGLADGECLTVVNVGGTNAFTFKNVAGDSGTSIATGKVALVIGSTTANGSKVYILN